MLDSINARSNRLTFTCSVHSRSTFATFGKAIQAHPSLRIQLPWDVQFFSAFLQTLPLSCAIPLQPLNSSLTLFSNYSVWKLCSPRSRLHRLPGLLRSFRGESILAPRRKGLIWSWVLEVTKLHFPMAFCWRRTIVQTGLPVLSKTKQNKTWTHWLFQYSSCLLLFPHTAVERRPASSSHLHA